jgi:predicted DsbA family dithiol-disulfide isomerase
MREKTLKHFQMSRQAGVRSFPTVIMQDETGPKLLTNGYRPYDELQPAIESWLESQAG